MSVYVGDPFVEEKTSQDTTISAQLLAHLPWIWWSQATYSGYCMPQDTIKIMLSAGVQKQKCDSTCRHWILMNYCTVEKVTPMVHSYYSTYVHL